MKGKKKCKILKEIRKQIALQNDIEYVTSECKHQGDCRGTCPKCEAEVRYLEEELKKRSLAGKKVAVAGVAAAMVVSSSGCGLEDLLNVGQTAGDMIIPESQTEVSVNGNVVVSEAESSEIEIAGVPEVGETDGQLVPEDSTIFFGELDIIPPEDSSDEESEWETMGEEPASEDDVGGAVPVPEDSSEEEMWEGEIEIPGDIVLPEESDEETEVELGGEPMPDDYVGE